jgi:phosphatidylglycerol:prolipoprotein diacylglycerol transferase
LYPFIHLAEGLDIPTYFLVISLVVSAGLFWVVRRCEIYNLPKKNVLDLSLLLMLSALLGARLFHAVYENFDFYRQYPVRFFYLWEGGFVFYGGMILAFIAAFAYLHFIRAPQKGDYFDTFAPVLSFTYGFGRIGCFLAGCCYGQSCDLPWAIDHRHPTQLYATFWEIGAILLLLGLEKIDRKKRPKMLSRPGDLFILWLFLHAAGRILMEHYREDFRGEEIFGLSISTVFSFALLLGSATLLSGFIRRRSFSSQNNRI